MARGGSACACAGVRMGRVRGHVPRSRRWGLHMPALSQPLGAACGAEADGHLVHSTHHSEN